MTYEKTTKNTANQQRRKMMMMMMLMLKSVHNPIIILVSINAMKGDIVRASIVVIFVVITATASK